MLGLIPKLESLPKWVSGNWNHQALALPEGDFNEHTLVYGPPGSGKTAGLFRPMLFRAALEGRSAVVFDVKFPDQRQGLYAVIAEFRALERHVECFTPFAESSQSLDLFAGCEDFQKAVEVASIFVPLESVQSDSSYYRNQERRLLAALFMDGKLKGGVRLDEICARLKGGIQALETFIKHNDHLLAELRTFLDLHNDKIAGIMTGLAATLEPFTKGSVPLRLSGHGRAINLERAERLLGLLKDESLTTPSIAEITVGPTIGDWTSHPLLSPARARTGLGEPGIADLAEFIETGRPRITVGPRDERTLLLAYHVLRVIGREWIGRISRGNPQPDRLDQIQRFWQVSAHFFYK